MSEAADDDRIRRDYPVIADSLWQAASPQLRNMATLARQRAPAHPVQLLSRHQLVRLQQARSGHGLRGAGGLQPAAGGAGDQPAVHRELPRRFRQRADRAGRRGERTGGRRHRADLSVRGVASAARGHAAHRDQSCPGRPDHRLQGARRAVDAPLALREGAGPCLVRFRARLGGGRARTGRRSRRRPPASRSAALPQRRGAAAMRNW